MHVEYVEEAIELAGREVTVLRPPNADALIDEAAFDEDEFLPYWAELWPSGLVLARAVGEAELQGARVIRRSMPAATLIFVAPPSVDELARRLHGRATDTPKAIARRLEIAKAELAAEHEFDEVIVNDEPERAAAEVVAIMARRRIRETRHKGD